MGYMIAFDMVVNNYDRIPFIWSNTGNAENVIFNVQTSNQKVTSEDIKEPFNFRHEFLDVYSIDAAITPINKTLNVTTLENCNSYFANVEYTIETLCLSMREIMIARIDPTTVSDYHFPSLGKLTRFINFYTRYTLNTMGEFQV